jgi:hypothetical protein
MEKRAEKLFVHFLDWSGRKNIHARAFFKMFKGLAVKKTEKPRPTAPALPGKEELRILAPQGKVPFLGGLRN